MQCLVCGAEMHVVQEVQDGTLPVGFKHRTLKCLDCGDVERRLVFTREQTLAETVRVERIQSASPTRRRQNERVAKPGPWEQTVEKVRLRQVALIQQAAAERAAKGAAARINQRAEEFNRKWDNLMPRRQPWPLPEPSTPAQRPEAPAVNILGASSERSSKPPAPMQAPAAPAAPPAPPAPPNPPVPPVHSRTNAPNEPVAPQSAWARTVTRLRGRRNRLMRVWGSREPVSP
jgi:hypothetical protein